MDFYELVDPVATLLQQRGKLTYRSLRMTCFAVLCVLFLQVSPLLAQVYQWTDKQGRIHFTDNLSTVPVTHLETVGQHVFITPKTEVNPGLATVAPPSQSPAAPTPPETEPRERQQRYRRAHTSADMLAEERLLFEQIQPGMTEPEVYSRLGKPDETETRRFYYTGWDNFYPTYIPVNKRFIRETRHLFRGVLGKHVMVIAYQDHRVVRTWRWPVARRSVDSPLPSRIWRGHYLRKGG